MDTTTNNGNNQQPTTSIRNVLIGLSLGVLVVALGISLHGAHVEHVSQGTSKSPLEVPSTRPRSKLTKFHSAAVAAQSTICSKIGKDILHIHNGNAVDAGIASLVCTGVILNHNSGLGGGHIMTIYARPVNQTEKVLVTLSAREVAPLAAHKDMFVNTGYNPLEGGMSIAVPGEVMGMYEAWKRFGTLPWKDLLSPSIALLRHGYPIHHFVATCLQFFEATIRKYPNLREIFINEDGSLMEEGTIVKDLKLARTLERIADDPDTFYNGDLAQDIVDDIAEHDGIVTLDDLKKYRAKWLDPVKASLQNGKYHLYSPGPPGSGHILNFIMQVLDGYDFSPDDISTTEKAVLTYHRIIETFKFAYAKRSLLGDEDFVDIAQITATLTSGDFMETVRRKINDSSTQDIWYYEPDFDVNADHGTAQLSVLAPDGSAVSITATINNLFGSMIRGRKTGILFNDEMDDFSVPGTLNLFGLASSPSNYIEPGKAPMSSMCPIIITNNEGQVVYTAGATGGSRIITIMANSILYTMNLGLQLDDAVDVPHIHHQLIPHHILLEKGFNEDTLKGLKEENHKVEEWVMSKGSFNCAMGASVFIHNTCTSCRSDCQEQPCIHAVSDYRQGEPPDGF